MITINKIVLVNFISHPLTEIEFKKGDKILINGMSGAGKSSIIDAIIWCLYGVGRSDNKNLIMSGRTESTVSLYLEDDKGFYRIIRNVKKSGVQSLEVSFSEEGKRFGTLIASGVKEGQKWIEKDFLRASYKLFVNSVAYTQGNEDNFIKETSSKRKELLLEIIGFEKLDEYYEKTKNKLSRLSIDLSNNESIVSEKKNTIESYKEKVKELDCPKINSQSPLNDFILELKEKESSLDKLSEKEEKRKNLESLLSDKEEGIRITEESISKKKSLLDTINKEIATILCLTKREDEFKEDKERIEKRLVLLKNSWGNLTTMKERQSMLLNSKPNPELILTQIDSLEKQLNELLATNNPNYNDACKKCPLAERLTSQVVYYKESIVSKRLEVQQETERLEKWQEELSLIPEGISELITNNLTEADSLQEELDNINNKLISFAQSKEKEAYAKEVIKDIQLLEDSLIQFNKTKNDINIKIDELEVNQNEYYELWDRIKYLKEQITIEEERLKQLTSNRIKAETYLSMIKTLEDELVFISEKITSLKADCDVLEEFKKALGPNGIKAIVIDYTIPKLEEKINAILNQMSDFVVRLDTQKDNAKGDGSIEGLFINIVNSQGEVLDFNNYSGGEKLKITVAISEALASLQKVGFRIFDELFIGLDEESTLSFADVMDKLQENFDQVLCISHLRAIKDTFDQVLDVTKVNGHSSVKIEYNN